MNWKMTQENKRIAELVRDGASPTKLAKETGLTRVRIYQIFDAYCRRYLMRYEYAEAMESGGIDRLKYYLKNI